MGEPGSKPKRPILVVEDDEDIRDLVTETLRDAGYAVAEASNGAEALEEIDRRPQRAVLLGMRMPIMDGWQFAERFRQRGQTARIF